MAYSKWSNIKVFKLFVYLHEHLQHSCYFLVFKIVIEAPGSSSDLKRLTFPTTVFVCSRHTSHFRNVRDRYSHEVYASQHIKGCSCNFPQKQSCRWEYCTYHSSCENPRGTREQSGRRMWGTCDPAQSVRAELSSLWGLLLPHIPVSRLR